MRVFIIGDRRWDDEVAIKQVLQHFNSRDKFIMCKHYKTVGLVDLTSKWLGKFHFKKELLEIFYTSGSNDMFRQIGQYLALSNVDLVIIFYDGWQTSTLMKLTVNTCRRLNIQCVNIHHNNDNLAIQEWLHPSESKHSEEFVDS